MIQDDDSPALDAYLGELMYQAQQALAAAGLTVDDFLDELPAALAEVVREAYGDDVLRELERVRAELLAAGEPE